jgi:4a-hydroxytetrahydrobiopterin dehydratase
MSDKPVSADLLAKHCTPCEGGVPALSPAECKRLAASLPDWKLNQDASRIIRSWTVKNFLAGIEFFNKVATLAEQEGHHPDLHLEGYRNVSITIWTHAAGGLTENDFILAAKIDQIPVSLRKTR